MEKCYCGSQENFENCCGRFIIRGEVAQSPEQLMRSRYSAFVLKAYDYLFQTWHSNHRPSLNELKEESGSITWIRLKVLQARMDGDNKGFVEFIADCRVDGCSDSYHELSEFVKEKDVWYYTTGVQDPFGKKEPNRNDPCSCGSGEKYKKCCGVKS